MPGDTLYELSYLPDFGKAARSLRDYDHDIMAWWDDFRSRPAFTKPADDDPAHGCSAARPASRPTRTARPCCRSTRAPGALRPDVWQRWLDWDPVRMVTALRRRAALAARVWIDAGTRDEYFLDLGAEAFRAELDGLGVPADRVYFELFDGGHMAIDYRYPLSLSWLAHRLAR